MHTLTQTPTLNREDRALEASQSWENMVVLRKGIRHRYEDLPRAWRVALRPAGSTQWSLRLGLAENTATEWNGANLYLPAETGLVHRVWKLQVPAEVQGYEVTLWRDDQATELRSVQF